MTTAEYKKYQETFEAFMVDEGLNCLTGYDGSGMIEPWFSARPCDCCRTPLGGDRIESRGYNPTTKQIQEYEICTDCEYYSAYGQLDDMTMMDMEVSNEN